VNGPTKYAFDNCAAVDFSDANPGVNIWPEGVSEYPWVVSIVTRMELMSYPKMSAEEKIKREAFLQDTTVMPINDEIEATAIAIRKTKLLKLPDAITAATSIVTGATLLTSDPHLLRLKWKGFNVFNILPS
jgi:predicted nucleic acid-binding protein